METDSKLASPIQLKSEATPPAPTTPSRPFKCDHCTYATNKKYYLEKHSMLKHHGVTDIQWYKCAPCQEQFKTNRFLEEHVRLKHAHLLQCPHCEFIATSNYRLRIHQQDKHRDKTLSCNFCFHNTKCKQRLDDHIKKKHSGVPEERFQCKRCKYQSDWKQDLLNHKCHTSTNFALVLIKSEPQDGGEGRVDEFKYVCESCEYRTNSKGDMDKHTLNQHTDLDKINWHECAQCSFKCKQKSNLTKHYIAKHAEVVEWRQCPHCSYRAKTRDLYTKHLKIHADYYKSYQCDVCSYSSARKYGLERHLLAKHKRLIKQ